VAGQQAAQCRADADRPEQQPRTPGHAGRIPGEEPRLEQIVADDEVDAGPRLSLPCARR
jgi:hypothetical protein